MKRTIAYLVVALCVICSLRADQTIQSVQQALKDQGFYYGNVSGEKSAETTAAVRRYQIRNGLQVTGEINPETLRSLNVGSNSASSRSLTSSSPVTQPRGARPDDSSRVRPVSPARSSGEWGPPVEMDGAFFGKPYESALSWINVRIIAEVQRQLVSLGYYRGRTDGKYGRGTAFAVRALQSRLGILPTGRLDTSTLDALGLSDRNLAYLESAPWPDESWAGTDKKFKYAKWKHGKWKVKWKKHHHGHGHDD